MRAAAQIRSPSRVTMNLGQLMGEGLAVGLDKSGAKVIASAANLARGVETTLAKADTQLPDPGIGAWARQLDAGVRRSIVETSPRVEVAGALGGRGDVTANVVVNNPIAERASNSIAVKLRELAELGVLA